LKIKRVLVVILLTIVLAVTAFWLTRGTSWQRY